MNRLTLLIALFGMTAAGACLAEDSSFCTSMCDSEQRQCRANAQLQPQEERFMPTLEEQRNPLARTAQGAVPGQGARALGATGDNRRRLDRLSACDTSYQRCTRSCAIQNDSQGRTPAHSPKG